MEEADISDLLRSERMDYEVSDMRGLWPCHLGHARRTQGRCVRERLSAWSDRAGAEGRVGRPDAMAEVFKQGSHDDNASRADARPGVKY